MGPDSAKIVVPDPNNPMITGMFSDSLLSRKMTIHIIRALQQLHEIRHADGQRNGESMADHNE